MMTFNYCEKCEQQTKKVSPGGACPLKCGGVIHSITLANHEEEAKFTDKIDRYGPKKFLSWASTMGVTIQNTNQFTHWIGTPISGKQSRWTGGLRR